MAQSDDLAVDYADLYCLTQEEQFLLTLLGLTAGIPADTQHLDWLAFERSAPLTLWPFLDAQLAESPYREAIPERIRKGFRDARRFNAILMTRRRQTAREMFEVLDRSGFDAVLTKGMALAEIAYPDATLRPMDDIDLWVERGAFDDAVHTLGSNGFGVPDWVAKGWSNADRQKKKCAVLESEATGITVDVNAVPDSLSLLPAERLALAWSRARPIDGGGSVMRFLHPEDLLMHVCLHASHHHRFALGLRPLIDVAQLLKTKSQEWNWALMAEDWRDSGVLPWMTITMELARDLVGAPVPNAVPLSATEGLSDIKELAIRIIGGANVASLPPMVQRLAQTGSPWEKTKVIGRRIAEHYRPSARGVKGLQEVLMHVRFDLQKKVPRYFAMWRAGEFETSRLRKRTDVLRMEKEFFERLDQISAL